MTGQMVSEKLQKAMRVMLGVKNRPFILENGCLNREVDSIEVQKFQGDDIIYCYFEGKKVSEICCDDYDDKSRIGYTVYRKDRMISFYKVR